LFVAHGHHILYVAHFNIWKYFQQTELRFEWKHFKLLAGTWTHLVW